MLLRICYKNARKSTTSHTFLNRYKCNIFSRVTAKINISFKIQNTISRNSMRQIGYSIQFPKQVKNH